MLLTLVVLVAGCGGSAKPEGASTRPSSSPRASQPAPPVPKLTGVSDGPPPAWLETEKGSRWLGYSSYCWRTACVDFIAPRCRNPQRTPRISLGRGERVTAHLGFEPTELGLTLMRRVGATATTQERLRLSREPSWIVRQPGVFSLFARAKGGDASYVACVVLR
jgi:hypothetical protein